MKKLFAKIYLIAACSFILFSCNKNSLVGDKLYILEPENFSIQGISVTTQVIEIEMNFINKEEVVLKKIVTYGTKIKSSDLNKTYNYVYENGFLSIPQLGINNTKLSGKGDFYVGDDETIYYKSSMLSLSQEEKLKRIEPLILDFPEQDKSTYLTKEIIYNNP